MLTMSIPYVFTALPSHLLLSLLLLLLSSSSLALALGDRRLMVSVPLVFLFLLLYKETHPRKYRRGGVSLEKSNDWSC
jgi:hypothetical protein